MSKQEIERILNSDFSDIDHTVNAKITSIDQITGKLTQRSNFLAQFQLLLQSQLGGLSQGQSSIKPILSSNSKKEQARQPQQQFQEMVLSQSNQFQINKQCLTDIKCKSTLLKRSLDCKKLQYLQDHINCLRLHLIEVKEEMRNQIQFLKTITLKSLSDFVSLYAQQDRKKKDIIKALELEILSLRQKNTQLTEQLPNPLKELTFQKSNEDKEDFNITKRLKRYQQEFTHQYSPRNSEPILNSEQWKTYRFKLNQHLHQPNNQISQDLPYLMPNIRNLEVGVPPIKNGFGILKSANQIIYRGMWRDGKFNGSGKLNWDGYCYEGNFQNGSFQGHGKLQIKNMVYTGKFKGNKLSGEGTLQVDGRKVVGIWQNNKLVRKF